MRHDPGSHADNSDGFLAVSSDDFENVTVHWKNAGGEFGRDQGPPGDAEVTYIFYDPFDAPEYLYIAWQNLKQSVFEDLIGRKLTEDDFGPPIMGNKKGPAKDSPQKKGFQVSGSCMF